jgi:hypothetical protein
MLCSLATGGAVKNAIKKRHVWTAFRFTFPASLEQDLQHQNGALILNIVCKNFGLCILWFKFQKKVTFTDS